MAGLSKLITRSCQALFALLAGTSMAMAQSPGDLDAITYYKTHPLRFIAGGGPGGGYDNYARLLAPYFSTELGNSVIVDNQGAVGGLIALNRMYATDNDGQQIIIMNGGAAVMSQLFELKTVQYDLSRINFLATVSQSPWVVLVEPKSPVKTLADLKSLDVVRWPATGPIDGLSDGASMLCEAFAMKCRAVLGYRSSNEGSLAIARNEMDALYVSDTSANNYIKSGQNRAIAVVARARSRFLPDMPTIFEQGGLNETQTWWMNARADIDALGRIIMMNPKAPPERVAFIRAIVRKVLTDPAVIAEGVRLERYIDFQSPEVTRERALGLINGMSAERKATLQDVVMKKFLIGAQ